MRYLLIDGQNLLMRARHVTKGDPYLQASLSLHITFNSIRSAWNRAKADHVVFCFEGRSWRKDVYKRYKANRTALAMAKTQQEKEEDEIFYDMASQFITFIKEKTNCTVLQHNKCEADDLIARWIQVHNESMVDKVNNKFVILSSDSDFQQLIDTNVEIYDGVGQKIYKADGIYNEKGGQFRNKKGEVLPIPDPEWLLFEKCIRGDTSDNVMSAYPGVRLKSSKKAIGIEAAFEDRNNKGYAWNNFMLQRWTDHNGVEHLVKDRYNENKMLIDLSMQPQDIKDAMDEVIAEVKQINKKIPMIGAHLLKFCGKFDLQKISANPSYYIEFLNASL